MSRKKYYRFNDGDMIHLILRESMQPVMSFPRAYFSEKEIAKALETYLDEEE